MRSFFILFFSTGVVVLVGVTENPEKEFKENFLPRDSKQNSIL